MKELAETAMNDILGWYGYDSVDRLEMAAGSAASGSASGAIEHADSVARLKPDTDNKSTPATSSLSSAVLLKTKRSEAKSGAQTLPRQHVVQLQSRGIGDHHFFALDDAEHQLPVASSASNPERRAGRDAPSSTAVGQPGSPPNDAIATRNGGIVLHHQAHPQHHQHHLNLQAIPGGGGGASGACDSSTSEKDSSRESSKSPLLMKMLDKQEQTCQWCRKVIPSHQSGILGTTEGMIFCTEACFSQSRRASFKRAKTCDWCRHVRHAVSYVDFQDGASQLQFCSDKCLNQYKMQIFCNETQAHLEMNPHLKEKSTSAGSLITPELWMKNCKSCSMSPLSDGSESVSPVPTVVLRSSPEPAPGTVLQSPTPAKKPLISVAPPSKLLSKSLQSALSRPSNPKTSRKRRTASHRPPLQTDQQPAGTSSSKRSSTTQQQAEYLMTSGPSNSVGINLNNNNVTIPNNNLAGNSSAPNQPKPCTVISSNVQDLRMLQKKHVSPGGFEGREGTVGGTLAPPPPQPAMNISPNFLPPPLNLLRPPFFHINPAHLRFNAQTLSQPQPAQVPPPPPPPLQPSAQMGPPPSPLAGVPLGSANRPPLPGFLGLGAPPPPVTILVPYPIIVPLPLPIPVPIPVIDFLRAALPKEPNEARNDGTVDGPKVEAGKGDGAAAATVIGDESVEDDLRTQEHFDLDAPLDFTVASAGKSHDGETYERPTADGTPERPREVQGAKAIGFARPFDTPLTIINHSPNEDEIASNVKQECAKQCLPKIKISLQEARIVGGEDGELRHEEEGATTRPALDNGEEDMERERKDMAERSRPLRKRKRLVVQQHLEPELTGDGVVDDPENGSTGGLGTDP